MALAEPQFLGNHRVCGVRESGPRAVASTAAPRHRGVTPRHAVPDFVSALARAGGGHDLSPAPYRSVTWQAPNGLRTCLAGPH